MFASRLVGALLLAISMLGLGALAQDSMSGTTIQVMESEPYGDYVTDSEGNAVYIFVASDAATEGADPMTEGIRETAVSCTGECLEAWPAFTAEGEVEAVEGIDAELVYLASFDDRQHVVFNGWPLFYFVQDEEPGETNGHGIEGFGGVWYLIGPDGKHLEFQDPAESAG